MINLPKCALVFATERKKGAKRERGNTRDLQEKEAAKDKKETESRVIMHRNVLELERDLRGVFSTGNVAAASRSAPVGCRL